LLLSHNQGYQVSVSENPHKKTILGSHKNYKKGDKPKNRTSRSREFRKNRGVGVFLKKLISPGWPSVSTPIELADYLNR
jgi:hypothetical protein